MKNRARAAALVASGVAAATVLAVVASNGNPGVAVAPALALLVLCEFWKAPLRVCVLSLFFLCVVADAPQDNPMSGYWRSPLYFITANRA